MSSSSKLLGGLGICTNCNKEAFISVVDLPYNCHICKKDALNANACLSDVSVVHLCVNHSIVCIVCCLCADIHKKSHEGKISCPCGMIIESDMRSYLCGCSNKCGLKYCCLGCKINTEKKKLCSLSCCISTLGKHCYKLPKRSPVVSE